MAETEDPSPDNKKSGCGLLSAVFGKRGTGGGIWGRRGTSTGSIPAIVPAAADPAGKPHNLGKSPSFTKRRKNSDEPAHHQHPKNIPPPSHHHHQIQIQIHNNKNQIVKEQHPSRTATATNKKVPKEAMTISGELESMINDHQRSNDSHLVRASSSNVMLYGNLGNLRQQPQQVEYMNTTNPKNGRFAPNSVMKNQNQNQNQSQPPPTTTSLCRALSTRMDPEQLKMMGNEDYKNGNFAEALALYEAAIAIDPNKAAYRSNKSAALTALGRILDAVFECREAIRIEPTYHRAHHRLANLYLRLGDVEKSIYHYKHAGPEADHVDISKAKALQLHLTKCTDARRMRDWNTLVKETEAAISGGADSAPQIYALQAEALLKHNKHQEANESMNRSPNFDDAYTKFFGPLASASILAVRAQVDMAMGRFEEATNAAQRATRLDPNNREGNMAMRKARAVGAARAKGNELFKGGKFQEASAAYGEGLEHDPHNSVLLCNRAACRSKLGQLDKAVDDCNSALNVRPAYAKARLRRADCYSKLEKWEASIEDYELLHKESPEDEEVKQGLLDVKSRMRKQRGGADNHH
ncbi:Inactive TPR repeat-containing thioredoxin TTL3 [Linum grandiflorum]